MSTARERGARFLLGNGTPLTMRQRRITAGVGAAAAVIVVVQLVLGAWLLATFWAFVATLTIVTVARDARQALADGRLRW